MGGGLRGSLGSGATRTWPPPWPLLGLPPPAVQREQNRVRPALQTPHPLFKTRHLGGRGGILASLVLASPFSEWFSSFASASAFSFAFLVFLSSFLSFTAFSFCGGREQRCRPLRGGEQSHSGQGSLTFAAFLAFGSGLGWAGLYDNNRQESSKCDTYTSLPNNEQFSCFPHLITAII